jgi:hypothetical protein
MEHAWCLTILQDDQTLKGDHTMHVEKVSHKLLDDTAHRQAQGRAKEWYITFRVRVCRVEREYGF